jgi:hypothetical protein
MESKEFMSIEEIVKIKSKYALVVCEENGKNEETNDILWYASYLIKVYERFGLTTKITKDIYDFRKGNWELYKLLQRRGEI